MNKERAYGSFLFDVNGYKITGLTINKHVTDPIMIGGLFGYINGATISNVPLEDINVISLGFVGGLVGEAYTHTTISNSYWNKDTTRQKKSAGEGEGKSEGKTTDEMKLKETYLDWKFDTIWTIQEGTSYPTLINNPERP